MFLQDFYLIHLIFRWNQNCTFPAFLSQSIDSCHHLILVSWVNVIIRVNYNEMCKLDGELNKCKSWSGSSLFSVTLLSSSFILIHFLSFIFLNSFLFYPMFHSFMKRYFLLKCLLWLRYQDIDLKTWANCRLAFHFMGIVSTIGMYMSYT